MYKITVFIIVFISLSIVTVGARLIWDSGSKKSARAIDLQNDIALDSLTNSRWPVYHGSIDEGQTNVRPGGGKVYGGNGLQPSHFYSPHSGHNGFEFDTHFGSRSNSNSSQFFDVDATQEYVASLEDLASMDRSRHDVSSSRLGGGSASTRSGGGGSVGGGSGSGSGSGDNGLPGYSRDPVPEIEDVANGENPEIPDWVYPPVSDEILGAFPIDSPKGHFIPVDSVSPVPEPATILLFGAGLASLVGFRLRRKKA